MIRIEWKFSLTSLLIGFLFTRFVDGNNLDKILDGEKARYCGYCLEIHLLFFWIELWSDF